MKIRFSEEFRRIERVGNLESGQLIDPVDIQVVLHDEQHSVYLEGEAVRGSRGRYWVDFDDQLLQPGVIYSIYWRYEPIADVVQVKRYDFKWDQRYTNQLDGYCLIYGRITDGVGMPLRNRTVLVVQYEDFAVRTNIQSKIEESTDALGHWSFLAKWGEIYQIIINDREQKTILIPEKFNCDINDLDIFQVEGLRTDKFGNPLQITQPHPILNRVFMGNRFGRY